MDFPATQMFVDEDADDEEKGDNDDENDAGTPLRTDKNIKIGIIITDLKTYPVFRGVNKIGRLDDCHIIIDHNTISKEHAEIEAGLGSKSTFISDLKSLNKTKLNDAVLRPGRMYQLRNGDTLRFGSVNAVFKAENIEEEKSKERFTFVIPETPLPIAKEARPVISGTPDHSFDGSLTEVNRSSDESLIAGTQDTANVGGNTSPILSGKSFSAKGSSQSVDAKGGGIDTSGMDKNPNISESDDENIFEMMTQESDIHDEETQKFPYPKTKIIIPTRFTMEKPESRSIEDLETQKFPGGDDERCSINDLETQKFPGGKIDSNSCSINDLETQKFPTETTDTRSDSINDLETQRLEVANKNDEDSETDEEGIFEESSEGDDMFDAPTQLIKSPRKASKLPLRIEEKYEEKKAEDKVAEKNKAAEVRTITRSKTPDKDISIEKKDAPKLNDSIESKLNHMFDEVNESGVDEPTQMLTQHLENILECTQNHESEIHQREGGILIAEKRIRPVPKSFNRIKTIFDDSDDENIIESGDIEINKASRESKKNVQIPRMLSSQEIFDDLPAVNFLSTSSTKKNQDIDESDKINKSKAETVNGQSDSENCFNRSKRIALSTTRNKDTSAKKGEVTNPKVEKPVKLITGKNLPIKKRGSSVARDTSAVVDKTPTARISKTLGAENPKICKTKRPVSNPILVFPPQRPKSPTPISPDENETSNKNMRSKRSRRIADKSSAINSVSKTETIPKQRLPKKCSNTSNETSEEEVIPTKKRKIISKVEKKLENKNISESCDSGTNQNETLATRSRKGRNKVNTSVTANSSISSLGIKSLDDAVQSSLESQEIQAILGVAEETNKQTRVSRYRQESNSVRSQRPVIAPKKYEEDNRPGFLGFAKSEILVKKCEDTFEEPVEIANRKKRQPRGSQLNTTKNEGEDTMNNRPKPRSKENKKVAKEISIDETKNISADAATPTSRGAKRVASRITADRGEKENAVEETPRKRGRNKIKIAEVKSEEIKSSQLASPLRRGRSSALATPPSAVPSSTRIKHKVLFTGLKDARLISIIHNLGGMITEKPNDCTVLVTDKVRRTYKFLCAMAMAVPIVSVNWLDESEKNERFLDPGDFLLHDPVEEAKFNFNLRKSLAKATNNKLLEGYTVVLTPNTSPPPKAEMTGIIQACGGKTLARPPTKWPEKSLIISRQEDIVNAKKFLNKAPKGVHLLSVEFILTGILRHELNFKDHKLSIP